MQQDRITVGEAHEDVLAAAAEAGDACAGQALLQTFGQRLLRALALLQRRFQDGDAFQALAVRVKAWVW